MKIEDEHNELLHWLALTFPGVYRMWTNKKNADDLINLRLKEYLKRR